MNNVRAGIAVTKQRSPGDARRRVDRAPAIRPGSGPASSSRPKAGLSPISHGEAGIGWRTGKGTVHSLCWTRHSPPGQAAFPGRAATPQGGRTFLSADGRTTAARDSGVPWACCGGHREGGCPQPPVGRTFAAWERGVPWTGCDAPRRADIPVRRRAQNRRLGKRRSLDGQRGTRGRRRSLASVGRPRVPGMDVTERIDSWFVKNSLSWKAIRVRSRPESGPVVHSGRRWTRHQCSLRGKC